MVLFLSTMTQTRDIPAAIRAFRRYGGSLRTRDALAAGIHPATLYKLRDSGQVTELARGFYRLADAAEFRDPDLTLVGVRAPEAVVCLISALAYHGITTQIPAVVHLAVPRGKYHKLSLDPLPVQVYRYDPKTFTAGIEEHKIGSVKVKIYSVARTVVDVFKFRNKLGLDVAVEALRFARERKRIQNRDLDPFARLLRVENVMRPYLQNIE
jgi:predicted transcriptional regulator of viral defense system